MIKAKISSYISGSVQKKPKHFISHQHIELYQKTTKLQVEYEYLLLSVGIKIKYTETFFRSDWERNVELAQLIQQKLDAYKVWIFLLLLWYYFLENCLSFLPVIFIFGK